ncbi:MAG TPA: IS30 family transposase [Streptosporangiaceae bacterium]
MSVPDDAIYTWIYAVPKGELARTGIGLRAGRQRRKTRQRKKALGIEPVGIRSAEDQPTEGVGRQVPGRWEGDLVIGRCGNSAMGTLVEWVSRFLCPVPLPHGNDTEQVKDAIFGAVRDLPAHLCKLLSWNQGTEAAQLTTCTLAADLPVYFTPICSPWVERADEHISKLIGEYLPTGTDIPDDIDCLWSIADSINNRPRAFLGYRKPSELFGELMLQEAGLGNEIRPAARSLKGTS